MEDNVYSYHTFIYPFSWKNIKKTGEDFREFIGKSGVWEKTNIEEEDDISSTNSCYKGKELLTLYKEYQYFNPFTRKAIYGFDEGIVENYSFCWDKKIDEKAHYIIEKAGKIYDLLVNAIRLKIYNTGVALFVIEADNYDASSTIEDVKNINDYGRRVSMPILSGPNLCADKIILDLKDREVSIVENFSKAMINDPEAVSNDDVCLTHLCDIIKEILVYGSDKVISSRASRKDADYYIYPLLDDRMFVICSVTDEKTFDDYKNGTNYKNIYELIYIDHSDGLSCHDEKMTKKLVEEAEYRRWIGKGSMYFVTNYSFLYLAKTSPPDFLIETFLTQYYQMACLCIAQRASIMKLKIKATELSKSLVNTKENKYEKIVKHIMQLQDEFARFDTQLCFDEVSSEQQAIEIFNMLKKATYIEKEKTTLKEQISSLYDTSNTSLGYSTNRTMMIFTWISNFIAIAALLVSTMQISGVKSCCNMLDGNKDDSNAVFFFVLFIIVILILAIAVVLILLNNKYKRKRKL